MTGLVGGSAAATPSSPTPQPVANPATVTPQSTNPACEPATYVAAGFTYQAFTNVGDCDWVVPTGITTVDYVVIAGGGSGGVGRGGGGGAGGMRVDSATVAPLNTLTVTVGNGGGREEADRQGQDGQPSALAGLGTRSPFDSITAQGGGGGGSFAVNAGRDGGSGGGVAGSNNPNANFNPGAGTAGQGNAGGRASAPSTSECTNAGGVPIDALCAGGGGGGAGGVGLPGGQNPGVDDTTGGAGGPGLSVSWIDSTVALNLEIGDDSGGVPFFAGGGGGSIKQGDNSPTIQGIPGNGGVGGGGAGGTTSGIEAASGLAGTGSGGGGNEGFAGPSGAGGSGIIVLRYASTAIPACNPTLTTIKDSTFDDTVLTFGGVGTCEWTPPAGLTHLQFLLVGGGGGGGAAGGGGGGGGGILEDAGVAVSSGNAVTVTLGYGGLPGRVNGTGGSGAASQLIVGGTTYSAPAGSGGVSGVGGTGGAGGSGSGATSGGAGGAGAPASGVTPPGSTVGSPGNAGFSSTISGSATSYGGGGGGGISTPNNGVDNVRQAFRPRVAGGPGGGGAGPEGSWDTSNPGGPGVAGLGGGGGGGQTGGPHEGSGGRGGSGGLIIRYTTPLALASVNPASGLKDDTTALTVTAQPGEGFQAGATVDVGGDPCVNVVITSPTSLTCEVRPTVVGTFDIQVTNGGVPGTVATLANAFTVGSLPGAPVISAAPGNTTAAVTWSVADTGSASLTQVEFALDDTSTVYFTTTTVTSPTQLTGLTNGQTYTVYARVVSSVGAGPWSLPAQVTPANPVPLPPSAPTSVRAVAGDASAVVSWSPPATSGSIPVSTYRVTAQPGGQGCLVAAPTLTCTVTGLTNGTTYTFRVEALTGAGWSPAASSNPVTPGGVTPVPDPVPVPEPLVPGQSLLLVDGVPDTSVQVAPNTRENGLTIEGDDWSMDLDGLGPDGKPLNLGPNGALILNQQRQVQTTGRGFLASSDVNLYIDPPVQTSQASSAVQGVASATGIFVGTLRTTRSGTFTGVVTLPAEIQPGEHILQVVGTGPGGDQRAMNLGVIVAPWIVLDQGTRTAQRGLDRIRTTGETGGFEAGTRLTPWIRYSGQSGFQQGRATIRVQADGSFTWTRKIRANRGLTAYVSFTDTESNRVVWRRVR